MGGNRRWRLGGCRLGRPRRGSAAQGRGRQLMGRPRRGSAAQGRGRQLRAFPNPRRAGARAAGDVKIQWATPEGTNNSVILYLVFKNPVALEAIIQFDIMTQGVIVDQALTASALFLQAGRKGDRLSQNLNLPKVILKIGNTGFRDTWDQLWFKRIVREMRNDGLVRQQANRAARQVIDELRNVGQTRVGKP
jgi:hypothetical protein